MRIGREGKTNDDAEEGDGRSVGSKENTGMHEGAEATQVEMQKREGRSE